MELIYHCCFININELKAHKVPLYQNCRKYMKLEQKKHRKDDKMEEWKQPRLHAGFITVR